MGFFRRHKLITLLLIALGAYIYYNPRGKFGYLGDRVVVFNRMPIAFFDLYVDPRGSYRIIDNLSNARVLDDWWNRIQGLTREEGDRPHLIIGEGRGSKSFILPDVMANNLRTRGISIRVMETEKAIAAYNALKDEGKPVAALLRLQR